MFAKPLTFLLVFILTVVNFIVLFIPISLLLFPVFMVMKSMFMEQGLNMFLFMVSRISMVIIAYIVFDTVFGVTMRKLRRGCIDFRKATVVNKHKEILEAFEWLKKKFKFRNVRLFLDPNFNIANAYAIGSFSGSTVTITMGLLSQLQEKAKSDAEYLDAVFGILGHEMSHLTNQDFLPGLLTAASESACKVVSNLVRWIFVFIATILRIVPWIGWPVSKLIISLYNIVDFVIMAFFKLIFMPLYNFLINFFGRSIEYRCDRESAYAYGGGKMAVALSMLGSRSYFSLFSTHPSTGSRIKKVQQILPQSNHVRPSIINIFSNFISLVLVVFICVYSASLSTMPDIYEHYSKGVYYPIKYSKDKYTMEIMQLYYKYKPKLGK